MRSGCKQSLLHIMLSYKFVNIPRNHEPVIWVELKKEGCNHVTSTLMRVKKEAVLGCPVSFPKCNFTA